MAGKEEQGPRLFKWGAGISGFVVVVLVVGTAIVYRILGGWAQSGTFGDTFGAANALFPGLAFGGVIIAILLQRKELELQRKELELTRNELARTAEAQEEAASSLKTQMGLLAKSARIQTLGNILQYYSNQRKMMVDAKAGSTYAQSHFFEFEKEITTLLAKLDDEFKSLENLT